jgi:hypothetical protein
MLDVFNTASPQSANYQEFYASSKAGFSNVFTWVKPRGASMVRMLLIGGGAGGRPGTTGAGGAGGGSGAITSWIGPAIFIPDTLRVFVGGGGISGGSGVATVVQYINGTGAAYNLITANAGTASGGATSGNNYFGASGIFKSVAGASGAAAGNNYLATGTTFLSGGAGGSNSYTLAGNSVTVNYGYPFLAGGTTSGGIGKSGYFFTKPFLIGVGGSGGGGNSGGTGGAGGAGGIGCGGGGGGIGIVSGGLGGAGGGGAVFIWAW